MTPAMRNWVKKDNTIVLGVSAIDIDDHSDHDNHGHSAIKHDDHDHHDHGGVDPHVWHDPHNIIKMGEVLSKSLKKDLPERKLRKAISLSLIHI